MTLEQMKNFILKDDIEAFVIYTQIIETDGNPVVYDELLKLYIFKVDNLYYKEMIEY